MTTITLPRETVQQTLDDALLCLSQGDSLGARKKITALCAVLQKAEPQPCRSPYCECDRGKCTHPGFYDARHEPFNHRTPIQPAGQTDQAVYESMVANYSKPEPLCEDEGCPHHGSPHICISKPQAQAGEPQERLTKAEQRMLHDKYELANGGEVGEAPEPLITLQSHREAMAKETEERENVRRANIASKQMWGMLKADYDAQREALAKKDAALDACVEAGRIVRLCIPPAQRPLFDAAIAQCKEARGAA